MMTVEMKLDTCPNCEKLINRATIVNDVPTMPEPGDVSVCVYCCVVLIFDEELKLREISFEELDNEEYDKDIIQSVVNRCKSGGLYESVV